MDERIVKGLEAQFAKHRIVFWYDSARDMRDVFEAIEITGVEKVEIANNEFRLKYRILRDEPEQKFLLYKHGPQPELPKNNWLYDVQLAQSVFHADQISIWLAELALAQTHRGLVEQHRDFFKSGQRLAALKALLRPEDSAPTIRVKMICAATGAATFDEAVERLLSDLATEKNEGIHLLKRTGLDAAFWAEIAGTFKYEADLPDFEDFALELFKSAFARAGGKATKLSDEALVFFGRWKTNRRCSKDFEHLSEKFSNVLGIREKVAALDFRSLRGTDPFEVLDYHIISSLADVVTDQAITFADVKGIIDWRRHTHWFDIYEDVYLAIQYASRLFQLVEMADLSVSSFDQGLQNYSTIWFRIDQTYRKHIYHARKIKKIGRPTRLTEKVEAFYGSKFVTELNDRWQHAVDQAESWQAGSVLNQRDFYRERVGEYRRKGQKSIVIISDALRFEVGEELARRVRQNDRFAVRLEPALSALPSYTQLGMAALLPKGDLSFSDTGTGEILHNGNSTQGSVNREKALARYETKAVMKVLKAEAVLQLTKDEARTITRDNDVVYIYHNQIDAIGDNSTTEDATFDAAEKAIEELNELTVKLFSANASNVLITADHGFLFQQRALVDPDFLHDKAEGEDVLFRNRRFVLGRGLVDGPGFKKFSAAELGLSGDMQALIPRSTKRLRRKGSGSRFVHGGASLQEVVVPVLRVSKTRKSDIEFADVEILSTKSEVITSNQIAVRLYQSTPVTDKCLPRTLSIGLFAVDDTLISEQHIMLFDSPSNDTREREQTVQLILSREADAYNDQEVSLKLQEKHNQTSTFKDYKTKSYKLRPRIGRDFDF